MIHLNNCRFLIATILYFLSHGYRYCYLEGNPSHLLKVVMRILHSEYRIFTFIAISNIRETYGYINTILLFIKKLFLFKMFISKSYVVIKKDDCDNKNGL